MSYYDDQESVANIYHGLIQRGWKCYGYKADQSDSMTDYWSPARWEGIAEKDGFILLVDVSRTHDSGRKITKQGFHADYNKINKLTALMNDSASTEGEKESCRVQLEKLHNKENESMQVIEQYPTYTQGNPKGCNWHIEKDGEIIAKGKGAYQCTGYLWGNEESETMKRVNAFVDKIESHINNNEQLEKVIKKQVKKVTKPIPVTDRKTLQVGDVLTFDYHGHYWQVISITTRKDGKVTFTYEILGSEKRGFQRLKNGQRYYDYMTQFDKNLESGRIKLYELKEVEEVTEKVTYKKTKRTIKNSDQLLETEQPEEKQEEPITTITDQEIPPKAENEAEEQITVTMKTGTGKNGNGIELYFTDKPSAEVREQMKSYGFRWAKFNRCWWAIETPDRLTFAESLTRKAHNSDNQNEQEKNDYNSECETMQSFSYPSIDIDDLDTNLYNISQELSDRENDSSWTFRTSKRDHNKEVKDTLQYYQNEIINVLETTDNDYYIYKLKQSLQRFKKNYHAAYVKYITHKANNPSWVVTGASGRNKSKDAKMNSRQDKLMFELINLTDEMKKTIDSYKWKIRKDKKEAIKKTVANTSVTVNFVSMTKEFAYMGIKEKRRVYVSGEYWICKLWNMFRVFKNGKEIDTTLKTTDTLETAKKYVQMLINSEQAKTQEQKKTLTV